MDKQALAIAKAIYRKPFDKEPVPLWNQSKHFGPDNKTCWYISRCVYDDAILGVLVNQNLMQQPKIARKKRASDKPAHRNIEIDPA